MSKRKPQKGKALMGSGHDSLASTGGLSSTTQKLLADEAFRAGLSANTMFPRGLAAHHVFTRRASPDCQCPSTPAQIHPPWTI
jgi:hypothetical protein